VAAADAVGGVWLDALRMTIIPLVFALMVTGMARAAETAGRGGLAGRALVVFAILLLVATGLTALAAPALLSVWPAPAEAAAALRASAAGGLAKIPEAPPLADWLRAFIPANPVKAAAEGAMASLVVFALIFGLAISRLDSARREALVLVFDGVQAAMMVIVGWVLALAPLGVFLLALTVGARTGVGAVGLLGPHPSRHGAGLGHLCKCPHLLAFDHHVQVMRREASVLEPGPTPDAREQRIDLAEMGRTFNRAGPKTKRPGHLVVVQRGMPAVGLIGKHLARRTRRTAQDQRCIEAHEDSCLKRRVLSPSIVCRSMRSVDRSGAISGPAFDPDQTRHDHLPAGSSCHP
jgi:hypothetical protein